jgi:hypothetical protein
MFVLAQFAQLIESKAQAGPANDMAGAPGRRFRSWLQNINHQTDNAPWVTKSGDAGSEDLIQIASG